MKGDKFTPRQNDEKDKITGTKDKGQNLANKSENPRFSRSENLREAPEASPKQNKQGMIKREQEKITPTSRSASHAEVAAMRNAPETVSISSPFDKVKKNNASDFSLTSKQRKKLSKYRTKAENKEEKYFKRESKLPKRQKLRLTEKQSDEKRKVKLHFEEQTKAKKEKLQILEAPTEAIKKGASTVANTAKESLLHGGGGSATTQEKDTQQIAEKAIDTGVGAVGGVVTAPIRFLKWRTKRKYEKFDKATGKAVKANTKLEYKKFRFESTAKHKADPLRNAKPASNPVSRALQKRRFMKDYRKELKQKSRKVGRSLGQAVIKVVNLVTGKLKKIGLIIVAIVLIIVSIGSCMQGMGLAGTGVLQGIFSTTYPADDKDLSDADWYFTDLETGLVDSIQRAEENHPNYHEYHYFLNGMETDMQSLINAINHDPFAFLSFISVMHEDFTFADIQGDLLEFFNVMYQIDFETITETRTREDGNGGTETYTYYILNTKLTVADWETVIKPYLESKEGERQYDEYIGTGGNHQMFGTPFNFDWSGIITCPYGGRDNPTGANTGSTTANGQEMHTGLDIGVPVGTPIYSIMSGTVTFAGWHDLYGNYVDVVDKNGNKSRYAHCNRLLVSVGQEVREGQVIAESGRTGNVTGAHLHIEIFLGGTRVNPIFLMKQKPSGSNENESEG